jgi:Domain of unknown function (DUF1876)
MSAKGITKEEASGQNDPRGRGEVSLVMNEAADWSVSLSVSDLESETQTEARLVMGDGSHLSGHGRARRNPVDRNVTKIGEEIAVARALSDLAHRLLQVATTDVEAVTHQHAHLHM